MRKLPRGVMLRDLDSYDEVWFGHDVTGGYWWVGLEPADQGVRVRGACDKASAGFSSHFDSIDQARRYLRSRFPDAACHRGGRWPDSAGFTAQRLEQKQLSLF